jgi:phosphoglucosamine mutase
MDVADLYRNARRRHRILIGRDTRLSGPMIEDALVAGICSMGVDALTVGVLPTMDAAFLTQDMKADATIMISASHNPFENNGIKIATCSAGPHTPRRSPLRSAGIGPTRGSPSTATPTG